MSWNIESDLKKALRSLKNQGISVNEEQIPPDGPVFFVNIPPNGFALTQSQILKLYEERQLDSLGIKDFALREKTNIESDIRSALELVGNEQLCAWTEQQICEYVNDHFKRVHSIRQVRTVLNRLAVSYRRS